MHWDKIPNDNDDEVAARGILYLLIFQQLGQLVRWSWGYHILLAPKEKYEEEEANINGRVERGESLYRDDPDESGPDQSLIGGVYDDEARRDIGETNNENPTSPSEFASGGQTPINGANHTASASTSSSSRDSSPRRPNKTNGSTNGTPRSKLMTPNGVAWSPHESNGHITTFPAVERGPSPPPHGIKGHYKYYKRAVRSQLRRISRSISKTSTRTFTSLPPSVQKFLRTTHFYTRKFLNGVWEFMNPPLWAMLIAIVVASIPALQHLFFDEGTFVRNSVTRAIGQSGSVAVPLILVVLGANLARNTLPEASGSDIEDSKIETKLLIASLISRMVLPTVIMAPLLAVTAKYVPVSILDDPIFVIVCFLLTGAPSALQLAQICQINNVYMGAMSKLLFQSYVVWYVIISEAFNGASLRSTTQKLTVQQDLTINPHTRHVRARSRRVGSLLRHASFLILHSPTTSFTF